MAVRIRILKCYVWSTLLYGDLFLVLVMMKKREDLEIWLYRKMLRISWTDRITNDEVYPRRMGTVNALLVDIVRRQLSFLGHVIRKKTGKLSSNRLC